jgi:hypothetical protein
MELINNIIIYLRGTGLDSADWFHLAQPCEHCNEPWTSIKGGQFLD